MKKKIFIGMAALFFAAITFYNVQVSHHNGDISMENLALMAQANTETPPPKPPRINECAGKNLKDYYCNISSETKDYCTRAVELGAYCN